MGFWSSLGSAISSAVSSIASGIGSALSGALSSAIGYVLNAGAKVLDIIESVGKALGLLKPDEKMEDMGDRAMQAAEQGIKPENYASHMEYMEAMRKVELSPEKSEKITPEEKKIAGLVVLSHGISQTQNIPLDSVARLFMLSARNSDYFNDTRMVQLVHTGGPFVKSVLDYFDERLDPARSSDVEKGLLGMEKSLNPELSDKDYYAQLDSALDAVRASRKEDGA